jgi:hypothetical protein
MEVARVHSSMIGKVEKAMRYAHEPDRVKLASFRATFAGDNGTHTVALQKMLDPMLSDAARETPLYHHVDTPAEEPVPA